MKDMVVLAERAVTAISLGESHFREFKSALSGTPDAKVKRDVKEICADIAQTLVAFANADGGELLVGVEDNGNVTGVDTFKEHDLLVMESAPKDRVHLDTPLNSVRASRVKIENHTILYFSVKKGVDFIHLTSEGRCLQRKDLSSVPIATEQIRFDRQESTSRAYDRIFVEGPQANALNSELVKLVADELSKGMSIEKCLQYLDLAEYADGGLKLRKAALLLFSSDPQKWHPRLQIRIIKVNGNDIKTGAEYNVTADDSITGNILDLIEKGWEGLRPHLVQTTLRENARFESRVMYPEYACREALVNAIAHRDYSQEGRGIEIYVYSDRMEVVNPGALLSTITVDDLCRLEGVHQSRNSLISRVLRELGYMRELGEGVRRIFELMTSNELAAPDLKSTKESFSITLHHKPLYSQKDLIWLEQFARFNLDRELKAIVLLGREGNIFSPQEIWDALGIVDTEHYRRVVDSLQKNNILINEVSPVQAKARARKQRIPTREFPRFKVVVPDSQPAALTGPSRLRVQRKDSPTSAPSTIPQSDLSQSNAKIYVGNLAVDVTKSDLFDLFSDHGEVIEIHIPMSGTHNNGYAFVEFSTTEQSRSAISTLNNFLYKQRPLKLREYNPKLRNTRH